MKKTVTVLFIFFLLSLNSIQAQSEEKNYIKNIEKLFNTKNFKDYKSFYSHTSYQEMAQKIEEYDHNMPDEEEFNELIQNNFEELTSQLNSFGIKKLNYINHTTKELEVFHNEDEKSIKTMGLSIYWQDIFSKKFYKSETKYSILETKPEYFAFEDIYELTAIDLKKDSKRINAEVYKNISPFIAKDSNALIMEPYSTDDDFYIYSINEKSEINNVFLFRYKDEIYKIFEIKKDTEVFLKEM